MVFSKGWDVERERFKQILDDRDSQITQLKIEGDVARSQVARRTTMGISQALKNDTRMTQFLLRIKIDSSNPFPFRCPTFAKSARRSR